MALNILSYEAEKGTLDGNIVASLARVVPDLCLEDSAPQPTGNFMQEIEHFRRDTFFRDTLSELYNYRYLLVLDDLKILGEGDAAGYLLLLVNLAGIARFQVDHGVIVASQVHDEIGQRLKDTVTLYREKRLHYDGSVMLFRKHCDYMIYAEGNSEEDLQPLIQQVRADIDQAHHEWGIESACYRTWFGRETPLEKAMSRLFALEVRDMESCRTGSGAEGERH